MDLQMREIWFNELRGSGLTPVLDPMSLMELFSTIFPMSVHIAVNSLSFVYVPSDARKNGLWLSKLPTINVKITGNKDRDRFLK